VNGSILEIRSSLSGFGSDIVAWVGENKARQANEADEDDGCKMHHV
jgi:hypothetical protein